MVEDLSVLESRIKELEARQRVSERKHKLDRNLHRLVDVNEVLEATYKTLQSGADGLPINHASILRPRKKREGDKYIDTLILESSFPNRIDALGSRVPYGAGVTGRVARSKSMVLLSNIEDADENEYYSANGRGSTGSEIGFPLLDDNGELIGVFEAQSDKPYAITTFASGLLSSTARILSAKLQGISRTEYDHLCQQIYGKKALDKNLPQEVLYALRNDYNLSFAGLDIDGFKQINDTYGHQRGDEIISACGDVLAKNSRESDLVYHSGGDEFIILLPETDYDEANDVLERIASEMGQDLDLQFSYGVSSLYHCKKEQTELSGYDLVLPIADALYEEADKNLYAMKAEKKNAL